MRSLLVCVLCLTFFASVKAQRFYYFETSNLVDRLLKTRLEKSNQYVVPSVMGSEYTVRTKVKTGDNARELSLEIVLADSVTQKEVFRSYEQFCFTNGGREPQLQCDAAIQRFLRRWTREMMLSAQNDHTGIFRKELTARRDNI